MENKGFVFSGKDMKIREYLYCLPVYKIVKMLFLLLLFSSDISCRRKKSYQKRSNDGISQKRTPVKEDVPNERFCFFLHCLRYNYKGVQLREEPR